MRKKILIISPFLGRSGMERGLAYFFEHYSPAHFELGFVYFQQLYPKTETSALQESLKKISHTWQIKVAPGFGLITAARELTKIIETWKPEIILGKEWFSACVAVFARGHLSIDFPHHVRVMALLENNPQHAFLNQLQQERLTGVKRLVYKNLLRQCEQVVGVSQGVSTEARRIFKLKKSQVKTIYNGVDLHLVQQQAALPAHHRWLAPRRDQINGIPVVVTIARLSPEKDVTTLIRALALLNKKRRVRSIIVGAGKELAHLKHLSKRLGVVQNIDFLGYTNNPFSLMARANVFVMTSLSEGFPSVLLEAMACGVPVVYTDCRFGPNEIIEQKKNGVLVPVGSPQDVAQAVMEILDDAKLRERLVKNGLRTIQHFSIHKTVRELSQLLQQL